LPYPVWLNVLAWASVSLAVLCAVAIVLDELSGSPQKMFIMNLVWPITALYWSVAGLWGYHRVGRRMTKASEPHRQEGLTRTQIAVAVSHCGAGCTLGDIAAESCVAAAGLAFAGGEFPTRLLMDLLLAWLFGIVFQYLTIAPMRQLSPARGIRAAIRADTLSIAAFEVGLFGWMALTHFVLFPNPHLNAGDPVFWFMMQIGMAIGFFTSYPANLFLLKAGWKEKMG